MYSEANLMKQKQNNYSPNNIYLYPYAMGSGNICLKLIFIDIQDGRRKRRWWNKWHKHFGYKMKITLMKRFWLFSFDEES